MKVIIITLSLVLGLAAYCVYKFEFQDRDWKKKIEKYQFTSDSLRTVVNDINRSTRAKDSILLNYMTSLDKTLFELNREARKNIDTIKVNLTLLDSSRSSYCQEMAKLNLKPENCN